jgi:hypothetical protein
MKRILFLTISLFISLAGVVIAFRFFRHAPPENQWDQQRKSEELMWKKIRYCDQDSDCILVPGVCGGEIGVNQALKTEAKSFIWGINFRSNCSGPLPNALKPTSAVCRKHYCTEIFTQQGAQPDAGTGRT